MNVAEIKAKRQEVSKQLRALERRKEDYKQSLTDYLKEAERYAGQIRDTDAQISEAYKEFESLGQQWREAT
jgi:arylsulfatase A-like enzyme